MLSFQIALLFFRFFFVSLRSKLKKCFTQIDSFYFFPLCGGGGEKNWPRSIGEIPPDSASALGVCQS